MDIFSEIGVFTRVATVRSFTQAAAQLGMTPSGVSRVISRLEARLGVRLLNRTTRSSSLTDEGAAYLERCSRILTELEDANSAMARSGGAPRGRLRVDVPVVLGEHVIGPALPRFLKSYPDVAVDLSMRDQLIDPTAEGVDVVVRLAELKDSELLSRKLGTARRVTVGSPAYFAKHGRPKELLDLRKHACLGYLSGGTASPWLLRAASGEVSLAVTGRLHASSGATLRQAAVAGLGIIQVFEYHVAQELKSGALEPVLADFEPAPRPVYALYAQNKYALPKVRVFLEFLAELFGSKPSKGRPWRLALG